MKLLGTLLLISLVGLIRCVDDAPNQDFQGQCMDQMKEKMQGVNITTDIKEIMDKLHADHNELPLVEIVQRANITSDLIKGIPYPTYCEELFHVYFSLDYDCLTEIETNDEFRKLVGANQMLDDGLGASTICLLMYQMNAAPIDLGGDYYDSEFDNEFDSDYEGDSEDDLFSKDDREWSE